MLAGAVHGSFWGCRTIRPTGTLPDQSPYGTVRVTLPTRQLVDPARNRLYFADFFCYNDQHYLLLPVTVRPIYPALLTLPSTNCKSM